MLAVKAHRPFIMQISRGSCQDACTVFEEASSAGCDSTQHYCDNAVLVPGSRVSADKQVVEQIFTRFETILFYHQSCVADAALSRIDDHIQHVEKTGSPQ